MYIYLIHIREFIATNQNIYKIGRTEQENFKRFNQYPKGSLLILQVKVNDCSKAENDLMNIFKQYFIWRKDYGNEYFEGSLERMTGLINYYAYKQTVVSGVNVPIEQIDQSVNIQERQNMIEKPVEHGKIEHVNQLINIQEQKNMIEKPINHTELKKIEHNNQSVNIQEKQNMKKKSVKNDKLEKNNINNLQETLSLNITHTFVYDKLYKIATKQPRIINKVLFDTFKTYCISKESYDYINITQKKFNSIIRGFFTSESQVYIDNYNNGVARGIVFRYGANKHIELLLKTWGYNDDDLYNILHNPSPDKSI